MRSSAYSICIATVVAWTLCCGWGASLSHAAAPSVRSLQVRGLRIGAATTLAFEGTDLAANPRVVMSIPIANQVVKPNSSASRVEIEVTLGDQISPGLYPLHLATDAGVSERMIVAVDRLPQLPFSAQVASLPVALHGTLASGTQKVTFPGRAGESVTCEVESRRWGGKLRPVLHLYDANGQHLAWSLPSPLLRGDARVTAVLPADGLYTVTLNDLQYNAPAPNHFRLRIGSWRYADLAFPAYARRGSTTNLRLMGGSKSSVTFPLAIPTSEIAIPAVPLDAGASEEPWSGPLPAVRVSDALEWIEESATADVTPRDVPALPLAINGWFSVAGEVDQYRMKVRPESKLRLEVFAERLGAELDTQLELRRENGQVLATNDDVAGTIDAALDYVVPKDVESIVIAIKDSLGNSGERAIYRLAVAESSPPPPLPTTATAAAMSPTSPPTTTAASTATPDFQLSAELPRYNVPLGRRQVMRLRVDRRDYSGPIRIEIPGLPLGTTIEGAETPMDAMGKLVTITATGETPAASVTSVRGVAAGVAKSDGATIDIVRPAIVEGDADLLHQPWLAQQIAIAQSIREGNDFDVDWQPPTDAKLVLGGKLQIPVKCIRPPGFDGPVRLTLLTSQNPPQANGKDDPNRTLRSESAQPVEIPADAKATAAWDAKVAAEKVAADARSLVEKAMKSVADAQGAGGPALEAATKAKAEADAKLAEAQTKLQAALDAATTASAAAKNDVAFTLLTPADLVGASVELALRAELLSRDKQRVLMTVATPVRELPVLNPLRVVYTGPEKITVSLDSKTGVSFKIVGKLERLEGIAGDATVSLVGLPNGVTAPKAVVKADKPEFELEVKLPPNTSTGPLAGVRLFATAKMTPQSPLDVRSSETPVAIEIAMAVGQP